MGIAEGNQAFMFAAVVAQQVFGWHRQRQAIVEDAFQIFKLDVFFICFDAGEKRGGRHLFRVAHDNGLLGACQRTHGFAGGQL